MGAFVLKIDCRQTSTFIRILFFFVSIELFVILSLELA